MPSSCFTKQDGFSLLEMIIVMAVFLVVVIITAIAFNTVLGKSRVVSKSEESNIEGIVSLDLFRADLAQAGYGLFTSGTPTYTESTNAQAAHYNDSPSGIPRAIWGDDNVNIHDDSIVLTGTDYLVIKATTVGSNQASKKWTYVKGTGTSKIWGKNDFQASDYVIAVQQSYKNDSLVRKLFYDTTTFAKPYQANGAYPAPFAPYATNALYYYYGIDAIAPHTPFNRVDYLVKRVTSDITGSCAPGAGVLYKAMMSQSDGSMNFIPLLDCVADMQVVLGWNTSLTPTDDSVDTYSTADGKTAAGVVTSVPMDNPEYIRIHLKLIKVYILAQDGGFDKDFTNTNTLMRVGDADPNGGESATLTTTRDLTDAMYQHYRWKLYRIVVRPTNLM